MNGSKIRPFDSKKASFKNVNQGIYDGNIPTRAGGVHEVFVHVVRSLQQKSGCGVPSNDKRKWLRCGVWGIVLIRVE